MTHEIPEVVSKQVPYTVINKIPVEEEFPVDFEITTRIDYSIIKKVPYVVSEQIEVTEYEKQAFHVEKKFPITVYDRVPYTVDIQIPYVEERQVAYTAQIFEPYEVTLEEERTIYELEEFVVNQQVPRVVSTPKVIVETDMTLVTVPTKETVEHTHQVTHDVNFGTDASTVNIVSRELLADPGTDDEIDVSGHGHHYH